MKRLFLIRKNAETMIKYFFSLPHVPNFDPEKPMLELNHIAENVVNVSQ